MYWTYHQWHVLYQHFPVCLLIVVYFLQHLYALFQYSYIVGSTYVRAHFYSSSLFECPLFFLCFPSPRWGQFRYRWHRQQWLYLILVTISWVTKAISMAHLCLCTFAYIMNWSHAFILQYEPTINVIYRAMYEHHT